MSDEYLPDLRPVDQARAQARTPAAPEHDGRQMSDDLYADTSECDCGNRKDGMHGVDCDLWPRYIGSQS